MITSDRNVYTPAHFTPSVKEALLLEARKQGKSMSLLIFETVKARLRILGYKGMQDETLDKNVLG